MTLDFDELDRLTFEITNTYRKIVDLFPKENEHILKHLASSSIHLALFRRDLHDVLSVTKSLVIDKPLENKFLN